MLGVTKEAVYQAIKRGRLQTYPGKRNAPMLDADTLLKDWNKNTQRPVSTRSTKKPEKPVEEKKPDKPVEERRPEPRMSRTQEYIPDYDESRARTEYLKAELLELDRQKKAEKLVPVDDVEAKWIEIVTLARGKMLGIPSKAKQRIPDLDAAAMASLEDIVRETLEDLAGEAEE